MGNLQNFTPRKISGKIIISLLVILICQNFFAQNKQNNKIKSGSDSDKELNSDFDSKSDFNLRIDMPFRSCWLFPFEKNNSVRIASDNNLNIYLTFTDGGIQKINSQSAETVWRTNLGGEVVSDSLIADENIYVVTKSLSLPSDTNPSASETQRFSIIRSLDRRTGITVWETKLPASSQIYLLEYLNNIIFADREGSVFLIQKQDGKVVWNVNLETELSSAPILEKDSVIFGLAENSIVALSKDNGEVIYKLKTLSPPTIIQSEFGKLFWGDRKGAVTFIDTRIKPALKTGKKSRTFRSGAEVSHIIKTPFGILICSFDNFVYLVSETSGDLVWKKRFSGRVSFKPLIVENYAVVVTDTDPSAFVLDLRDSRLVNKIYAAVDNSFVGSPLNIGDKFIFPTLKGLISFSALQTCGNKKTAGEN